MNEAPVAAPSQERKQEEDDKTMVERVPDVFVQKFILSMWKWYSIPIVCIVPVGFRQHPAVSAVIKAHRNENLYLKYSEHLRRAIKRKSGA